jgi:Leucine-rich repeat (LRR) protein
MGQTLPPDLLHNSTLKILDAGGNQFKSFADVEVLKQLTYLTNLNLSGR